MHKCAVPGHTFPPTYFQIKIAVSVSSDAPFGGRGGGGAGMRERLKCLEELRMQGRASQTLQLLGWGLALHLLNYGTVWA